MGKIVNRRGKINKPRRDIVLDIDEEAMKGSSASPPMKGSFASPPIPPGVPGTPGTSGNGLSNLLKFKLGKQHRGKAKVVVPQNNIKIHF